MVWLLSVAVLSIVKDWVKVQANKTPGNCLIISESWFIMVVELSYSSRDESLEQVNNHLLECAALFQEEIGSGTERISCFSYLSGKRNHYLLE